MIIKDVFTLRIIYWILFNTRRPRFTMEQPYMLPILCCQHHSCCCPGDLKCQSISRHGIDHISRIYSGVWQNDEETRLPPGNYSTASNTWIQASTNKMPAPDYACWHSNNCHCDIIMSGLWLWWSWRPHNLRFRKAHCISSSAAWCGRPFCCFFQISRIFRLQHHKS